MELTKTLFYGSIPMALISVGFFIYSNIDISNFHNDLGDDCDDFLKYNIIHLGLLLTSLLVCVSFICCGSLCSSVLFIVNSVTIISQLLEKYTKNDDRCDSVCQSNCGDLVDLSKKINICLICNGSIILVVVLLLLFKFIKKLICCSS